MFDLISLKVGLFLGIRQLKRSSLWSNILIVVIMVLTFLNLVVVSGLLVGLIQGAENANKNFYTSDLIISTLKEKNFIENSQNIILALKNIPGVENVSARYLSSGSVEANYQTRTNFKEEPEKVGTVVVGINPQDENAITGLSDLVIEGEYLNPTDFDKVLVGAMLLEKYLPLDSPGFLVLSNVEVGDKIKVGVGENTREVTVKGITKSKTDEVDRRVFMLDSQLKNMSKRQDLNVGEIVAKVDYNQTTPERVKEILLASNFDKYAKIQTFIDAQPKFLVDIKNTFTLLGNIISSIGLAVAAITIFIVIFINAITRRKYIGIMKAIGVDALSLEIAYIFQSLIYAVIGSLIGLMIVYFFLIPYFLANPINFPFSDGILVAPALITTIRVLILIIVTALAGYVPARIVISKNTLDSVLGRN